MSALRVTNLICGALLLVPALGFLLYLPGQLADYAREPEDVWLSYFWIGVLGLIAALCFVNAWRLPRSGWLAVANLAAVVTLATLLVFGHDDFLAALLLATSLLGPVSVLIGALHHARTKSR